MSVKRVVGTLAIVVALGACTRITDRQGFLADQELIAAISPGVDNRASVEKTLGRPTFISKWDENSWYYHARTTSQLAFLPSRPTSQDMLKITFDSAGNVAAVNRDQTLDQIVQVIPSGDKTPVYGRDSGFFADIFGNIGAVGAVAPGPSRDQ